METIQINPDVLLEYSPTPYMDEYVCRVSLIKPKGNTVPYYLYAFGNKITLNEVIDYISRDAFIEEFQDLIYYSVTQGNLYRLYLNLIKHMNYFFLLILLKLVIFRIL